MKHNAKFVLLVIHDIGEGEAVRLFPAGKVFVALGGLDVFGDDVAGRPQRLHQRGSESRKLFVSLLVQRITCRECAFRGQILVPFAKQGVSYAKCFERYAKDLLRFGTIDHVAHHLGVGWDMIKNIHKADLKKRFDRPNLKSLTAIAIDEFYAGRKTKYFTFVLDLSSGAIVYVGKGNQYNRTRVRFQNWKSN